MYSGRIPVKRVKSELGGHVQNGGISPWRYASSTGCRGTPDTNTGKTWPTGGYDLSIWKGVRRGGGTSVEGSLNLKRLKEIWKGTALRMMPVTPAVSKEFFRRR